MTEPRAVMEVRNLVKTFGPVRAVDGVGFDVNAGEVHGFIGPNGAGKTTTMRLMAGVEPPDSGDVLMDGVSLVNRPDAVKRDIGFMPDYLDSYPGLLVWEYLDFYSRIYGAPPARRRARMADVAEFTGMGEMRRRPVAALSKGWKQRLSLARVLLNDPRVLILDEPSAGLDPRARIELRELVVQLARNGKAVFISSHILSELSEMCDAVTIIADGRVKATGPVSGLSRAMERERRIVVRLTGTDGGAVGRLAVFVSEIPGISGVEAGKAGLSLSIGGGEAERAKLLSRMIAAGFPVSDYHCASVNLEHAFVAMTREPEPAGERR